MLKTGDLKTQSVIVFGIFILSVLFYNDALCLYIILQFIEYFKRPISLLNTP